MSQRSVKFQIPRRRSSLSPNPRKTTTSGTTNALSETSDQQPTSEEQVTDQEEDCEQDDFFKSNQELDEFMMEELDFDESTAFSLEEIQQQLIPSSPIDPMSLSKRQNSVPIAILNISLMIQLFVALHSHLH